MSYQVTKPKGHCANITVENTETKAKVIIGRLSVDILHILETDGFTFKEDEPEALHLTDEWNLTVSDETGKVLARKAMPMSKPIRDQRKPKDVTEKPKAPIDLYDMIFGFNKNE